MLVILILLIGTFCLSRAAVESGKERSLGPLFEFSQFPSVVLIIGVGKGTVVQHICTGSILNIEGTASHILTSAYCIRNKTDPTDLTQKLSFLVLVPDANGTTHFGPSMFTAYEPLERITHPLAGTNANFTFDTVSADGTPMKLNSTIDENDVGIIRLRELITVPGVLPVLLAPLNPPNGSRVDLVGFGGPNFYSLRKTDSLAVMPSYKLEGNTVVPNDSLLFFRDVVHTSNVSQAIEAGDEGGPMIIPAPSGTGGSGWVQIAIAQGTWRVSEDGVSAMTYASLGPLVGPYIPFINDTLNADFVIPTLGGPSSGGSHNSISACLTLMILLFSLLRD